MSIKLTIELPAEKEEKLSEVLNTMFEKDFLPLLSTAYTFARKITENSDEADDLVQEAYIQLYQYLVKNDNPKIENPKAFLYSLIKNIYINKYRRSQIERDRFYVIQASTEELEKTHVIMEDDKNQIGDEILNLINDLPSGLKVVFLLSDLEGFSYDEMSKILDIPIGTIRSRLHRARKFLAERLKDHSKSIGYNSENQ